MRRLILIHGFLISGIIALATRYLSYAKLSRYFGMSCKILIASTLPSAQDLKKAYTIARNLKWVTKKTPWHLSCLSQAILAIYWCRRARIPYILFIGLLKNQKIANKVDGHAWLMVGSLAVSGGDAYKTHDVISSYSNVINTKAINTK